MEKAIKNKRQFLSISHTRNRTGISALRGQYDNHYTIWDSREGATLRFRWGRCRLQSISRSTIISHVHSPLILQHSNHEKKAHLVVTFAQVNRGRPTSRYKNHAYVHLRIEWEKSCLWEAIWRHLTVSVPVLTGSLFRSTFVLVTPRSAFRGQSRAPSKPDPRSS